MQGELILPHDRETEAQVLGTLLRYPDSFHKVAQLISPHIFYDWKYKVIFQCYEGVVGEGRIPDTNSIYDYFRRHRFDTPIDKGDIVDAMAICSEKTLKQDVEMLTTLSQQRRIWEKLTRVSQRILEAGADIDGELNDISAFINDVSAEKPDDIASMEDALQELTEIVNDNRAGKQQNIQTGFHIFDDFYLLRPGMLTVIAAFTSVGKSALSMNIAVNAAQTGTKVAYYSLEMGKAELAARAISLTADIPAGVIFNKGLTEEQLAKFKLAVEQYKTYQIYIDEKVNSSFDHTIGSIRNLVKTKGIELAIIDYLQIYAQTGENIETSLAAMARAAKNVAKELQIAVILLSQLNRSSEHPTIRMLRGSGQIEESADNIVLIDRPEAYPESNKGYEGEYAGETTAGTAKLILAKGRGMGTGVDLINFDSAHTYFSDRNKPKKPSPPPPEQKQMPFPDADKDINWDGF